LRYPGKEHLFADRSASSCDESAETLLVSGTLALL